MKSFMEKEIFSQIEVLENIKKQFIKNSKIFFEIPKDFTEIKFIASGSSYNAIRLAHKFFETYTTKSVGFEYASEFISNPNRKINKNTLYCFASQSGETYDTKCALDIVKKEKGVSVSFVNNSNSTLYNSANYKVDVCAGVENSIAATKSFLATVVCLWLFALYFSDKTYDIKKEYKELLEAVKDVLSDLKEVESVAKILAKKKKVSIIGYNFGYILAKEGALKIKETSYIDTSSYPTGEFLHGHTAILNTNKTLIEIFSDDYSTFEKNTLNKIKKDFNPQIIAITDKKIKSKNVINFKKYKYTISKICAITVILQLLALKTTQLKGMDVDKPNGLNKVVTG